MTSARTITLALKGHWHGRYGTARCPAHDESQPSLFIADGNDGRLLLHCQAGCDFQAVLVEVRARQIPVNVGTRTIAASVPWPHERHWRADGRRLSSGDTVRHAPDDALASRANAFVWEVSIMPASEDQAWKDVLVSGGISQLEEIDR